MTNWLAFPTVTAPNPKRGEPKLTFVVSETFIQRNASNNRNTPILQLWTHVIGRLPPINNISKVEGSSVTPTLTTLHDAVACFSGINRPHDDEENGHSVLVYILNPKVSIQYEPSMTCQARSVVVPPKSVLTVQVRPTYSGQATEQGVNGIVTRLEFVVNDEKEPLLPKGFQGRYDKMLWRNEN
jgi:hypothetical protein